jgi:hypothetical protein
MNETDRLKDFITTAKARGISDEFVVSLLRQNGWSERRIYQAFSTYYEGVLGAPLPSRGGAAEYAGDAFLYLLAFISLTFWAYALGHLCFVLIDRSFPSGLDSVYALTSFRHAVTYELATIIVAFPIFLFVSRAISSGLATHPERAESGVRKWLIYIALVITTVTLVGDAIWFLNSFLQGDLTTRFVLKSFVLLAIARRPQSSSLAPARNCLRRARRSRGGIRSDRRLRRCRQPGALTRGRQRRPADSIDSITRECDPRLPFRDFACTRLAGGRK